MPIIFSDEMPKGNREKEWWYNSLDAAVTLEIHEILSQKNMSQGVYAFERALQGPALDMMLRGFLIDPVWRAKGIDQETKKKELVEERLNRLAHAVWGKDLNPRSPHQLKDFFYNELQLPEVWTSKKGVRSLSTDREALEKLSQYYIALPIINCVLHARDAGKKLSVLRSGVDPDGRMRCTYNVCGTETGRWASSRNVYGRGGNLQNITEELRRMFVADRGYILLYVDGEQAESRGVGFIHGRLFNDWRYLDACEAGDLHTTVTRLVWQNLGWTGDNRADRAIAEQPFYRHFSYRDMAKRGGHGTNYYGTPWTMARHLKVDKSLIEEFQRNYFAAFPAMRKWHVWVSEQLALSQSITTFVGRERTFFGRPNDDTTLREAIAYEPQSVVGDLVNEGGYRVWKQFPEAQALAQIHDAYLFQIPETRLDLIEPILKTFEVPVRDQKSGRVLRIPAEAKVGWNWAGCEMETPVEKRKFKDGNPDGLRKWKGSESRTRTEDPTASLLDRKLH
jgi:DNA polymerase-1